MPFAIPMQWLEQKNHYDLKAVLLHNSKVLASIPLAHSKKLSESHETLKLVLEKINPLNAELNSIYYSLALLGAHHSLHVSRIRIKYQEYEWQLCGDLNVIGLLLGQQRGYTKFPCFLCEWDSRARDKHWDTVH
jgi:hypothetical protein